MNTKAGIYNPRSEKERKVRQWRKLKELLGSLSTGPIYAFGTPRKRREREKDRKLIQRNNGGKLPKYENYKLFFGSVVVTTKKIPIEDTWKKKEWKHVNTKRKKLVEHKWG